MGFLNHPNIILKISFQIQNNHTLKGGPTL